MTGLSSASRLAASEAPDLPGAVLCQSAGFTVMPHTCKARRARAASGEPHQCVGVTCENYPIEEGDDGEEASTVRDPSGNPTVAVPRVPGPDLVGEDAGGKGNARGQRWDAPLGHMPAGEAVQEGGMTVGTSKKNPHPCPGYGDETCDATVKYGERCKKHANQANRAKASAEGRSYQVPKGGHKRMKRQPVPRATVEQVTAMAPAEAPVPVLRQEASIPKAHTMTVTLSPDGFVRVEIVPLGGLS